MENALSRERPYVRPGEAVVPLFARADAAVLFGGALAGAIASVPMLLVAMLAAWIVGSSTLDPLLAIASTAYGEGVMHEPPGALVLATGALLHLLVGVTYGVIFGTLVDRVEGVTPLVAGIVYSFSVFVVMFFFAVPTVAPVLQEAAPFFGMALAHLVYGVGIGLLTPVLQRTLAGDAAPPRPKKDVKPIPLPVIRPEKSAAAR